MKKLIALAMVLGVIGVFMGGCGSSEPKAEEPAAGGAAAPAGGETK